MSNFPHSTLATSLSTSPYALTNNLEALIQRSRAHPHAQSHRPRSPTGDDIDGDGRRASQPDSLHPHRRLSTISTSTAVTTSVAPDDSGVLLFQQDSVEDLAQRARDDERGRPIDGDGPGSRWRPALSGSYGAVEDSKPLVGGIPSGGQPIVARNATEGNSRSRSKGRTPPRTVMRPMTLAHRNAAAAAGASLGALPSVEDMAASLVSSMDDEEGHPGRSPYGSMARRGRSAEARPISPVAVFRTLPTFDDEADDEEAEYARASAFHGGLIPGAGMTGEILSCDPAQELDAADLNLPTDATGHEVHSARGALTVELPLLVKSTIPVFFTQLAEYSLSLASVISIGHLGTGELAASSLANMTASVTCFSIMQGLATALDTLLPAAWTSSDPTRVGLWTQRMSVVMAVAMIPMFVLWFNIEPVLLFLHQDPTVASLAHQYLTYLSIGIPGYAGNVVLKKYLQSQNNMRVPTYILFVVAPLNLVLNYLLVWGPDSIRLGFKGGAIATAISYNLTCIMLLVYILFIGPREAFHPLTVHGTFSKLGTVTSLGLAGTIMLSSEWWAWEVCALAASLLGPTTLAAQSVLLSTCSTLYQFPAALGVAASVRVGNLLGAGRAWEAMWASRASFILAFLFALLNSTVVMLFRKNWGYMFNEDPEVVGLVAAVMPFIALFQVMDGMAGAANAVLRALALHSSGAIVNMTAYYIIGIPLGLWLTFSPRVNLGLVGIWIGLTVALSYASVVGVGIVWRADWARAVERVRERLGLSQLPRDIQFADEPEPEPLSRVNSKNGNASERTPLLV